MFTIIYDWEGGILAGSVIKCPTNTNYIVRFSDGMRKIFPDKQQAEQYRIDMSLEKNLTRNQYRLIECDTEGSYYEMKLQDEHICKFDIDDLKYTQNYSWCANKGNNRYYMHHSERKNRKTEVFHRLLFPEYTMIDHINRDGLDNRRKNLRPVSVHENNINQKKRKDNASGKTGIHYSKYDKAWVCQWPEDGKRKKKTFSIGKYGEDNARFLALNHRQKMDNKFGLLNGYDSDGDTTVIVKPVNIENMIIEEKIMSTNTSGKTGVYYMENYKFWATEYRDENGKKKSKRFYVGKVRNYEEAKKLAMEFKI